MNVFIVYNVRKSNKAFSNLKTRGKDKIKTEFGMGDDKNIASRDQTQAMTSKVNNMEGNLRFQETRTTSDDKQRHEAEVHLTRMLLLITTSFLVFTTPTIVRFVTLWYIYYKKYSFTNFFR